MKLPKRFAAIVFTTCLAIAGSASHPSYGHRESNIVLTGVIYDLAGQPRTRERVRQEGIPGFDVSVSAIVVAAEDEQIDSAIGSFDPETATFSVSIPKQSVPRAGRVDITLESNDPRLDQITLRRLALRKQAIDVVMPKRTPVLTFDCPPYYPVPPIEWCDPPMPPSQIYFPW